MNKLQAAFNTFHAANPQIYDLFKLYALEAIRAGKTTLSITLISERIRWEVEVATKGDRFKLNNNHRAFYARLFHSHHPHLGQVFVTRAQQA